MKPLKPHHVLLFLLLAYIAPTEHFQLLSAQTSVNGLDASYSASKKFATSSKSQIRLDRITEDSLSHLFTNLLTEKIIPH